MKKIIILCLIFSSFLFANNQPFKMLEANQITGLIPDIEEGYGVAFRDFNLDGNPDIYLVCFRNLNRLLVNNGGIIPFIDRTVYSGLGGDLMSRGETNLELGASAADYDNDGLPDIFLAGWGKTVKLFHNTGRLQFADLTDNLQMQGLMDANQGLWLDVNNDGFLDLFVTDEHRSNRLFINLGNGKFSEALWSDGFADAAISQGAISADFDVDGDADIYVANWRTPDYLLLNDGSGIFKKPQLDLSRLTINSSSNSAATGDIDNDGDSDLLVAGHDGKVNLYRNASRDGILAIQPDSTHPFYNIGSSVYGILIEDFNQDGWLDIFLAIRENANRLYLNDGLGGFFSEFDTDGQLSYSTGCAAVDMDGDGDLDIFVANKNDLSRVYLNPINNNQFIKIRLEGVSSNRDAIGSKIYFYTGQDSLRHLIGFREVSSGTGYLSSKEPVVHFGTGSFQIVDAEIFFPSGQKIIRRNLHPGKTYLIAEYNPVLKFAYKSYNFIGFHIKNRDSIFGTLLFLVMFLMLYFYIKIGFRRYRWQAPEISTQLLVWFLFMLINFIAFRKWETIVILGSLNLASLMGIFVSAIYSEQQLSQRRKRARFRGKIQQLSSRMISIHENRELYRNVQDTIQDHDDVDHVVLFQYNRKSSQLVQIGKQGQNYALNKEERIALENKGILRKSSSNGLLSLFDFLQVNVLLPVAQEGDLVAVIGVLMKKNQTAVNREDLHLLQTLANQIAIAIKNNNYIKESARLVRELTEAKTKEKYMKALEDTNEQLDQKNIELNKIFKELQQKEGQLIHSEKMASLGHLVAGISHELNNPISFIYANTKALDNYLSDLQKLWDSLGTPTSGKHQQEFASIIKDIQDIVRDNLNGSQNVKELVRNLKNFSRLDQAEWKEVQLTTGIDSSLIILKPQITKNIQIVKEYSSDSRVYCNPGQLNQVFMNILSNAIQALHGNGGITITTRNEGDNFLVEIADTGSGIPKDIQSKIFNPFFTTKDVDEGSGLGLSISYTIVNSHGGKLDVKSEPGVGSIFTISLPLKTQIKSTLIKNSSIK